MVTEEERDEDGAKIDYTHNAVLLILLTLIVMSILFERIKEHVETTTSLRLKPVIENMFKELTVLGFLSLCTFLVVKGKFLQSVSVAYFGEKTGLQELIEQVHMLLFGVMMAYTAQVLLLTQSGSSTTRAWEKQEEICKDEVHVVERYLEVHDELGYYELQRQQRGRSRGGCFGAVLRAVCAPFCCVFSFFCFKNSSCCHPTTTSDYEEAQRNIRYLLLRHHFIHPMGLSMHPHVPDNFDFGSYLGLRLGELSGEVVELTPFTWLMVGVFFVGCWLLSNFPKHVVFILIVAFGGFLVLFMCFLNRHLAEILNQLMAPVPKISVLRRLLAKMYEHHTKEELEERYLEDEQSLRRQELQKSKSQSNPEGDIPYQQDDASSSPKTGAAKSSQYFERVVSNETNRLQQLNSTKKTKSLDEGEPNQPTYFKTTSLKLRQLDAAHPAPRRGVFLCSARRACQSRTRSRRSSLAGSGSHRRSNSIASHTHNRIHRRRRSHHEIKGLNCKPTTHTHSDQSGAYLGVHANSRGRANTYTHSTLSLSSTSQNSRSENGPSKDVSEIAIDLSKANIPSPKNEGNHGRSRKKRQPSNHEYDSNVCSRNDATTRLSKNDIQTGDNIDYDVHCRSDHTSASQSSGWDGLVCSSAGESSDESEDERKFTKAYRDIFRPSYLKESDDQKFGYSTKPSSANHTDRHRALFFGGIFGEAGPEMVQQLVRLFNLLLSVHVALVLTGLAQTAQSWVWLVILIAAALVPALFIVLYLSPSIILRLSITESIECMRNDEAVMTVLRHMNMRKSMAIIASAHNIKMHQRALKAQEIRENLHVSAAISLTEDHKRMIRSTFELFDVDDNGALEPDEFYRISKTMGFDPVSAKEIMHLLDPDNNGLVTVSEFENVVAIFLQNTSESFEEEIDLLFEFFDRDGDSKISSHEFMEAIKGIRTADDVLTDAQIVELIREMDRDRDGHIDGEEFAALVRFALGENGNRF